MLIAKIVDTQGDFHMTHQDCPLHFGFYRWHSDSKDPTLLTRTNDFEFGM